MTAYVKFSKISFLCAAIWVFSLQEKLAAATFNKSGVTPTTVALPQGPGSVSGIGESYQEMPSSGMSTYSIPIIVPSDISEFTPDLQIYYNSGNGKGPLGLGWEIDIPFIQRQTDKGLPRYVDSNNSLDDDLDGTVDEDDELDSFIDSRKEELAAATNGFFYTTNGLIVTQYERVGAHWEASMPDGTRLYFGETSMGRCVNPANTNNVFKWMLEREVDIHSNTIVYAYTQRTGLENTNQLYLSDISYGSGEPGWSEYNSVELEYSSRSDWFEDCRSGFSVRTGVRLTNIVVSTLTTEPNISTNFALSLSYHPQHDSLLSSITGTGTNLPPSLSSMSFQYGMAPATNQISANGYIIGSTNTPPAIMDDGFVDLLDVNGDALPDILKTAAMGGAHQVYINQGVSNSSMVWSGAHQMDSSDGLAWNINLDDGGNIAHLSDMDGDGISDLWYKTPAQDIYYFRNSTTNGWEDRKLMSIENYVPPAPFGDDRVKVADIDHDKRIDIIQSLEVGGGAYYRIWYNMGTNGYSRRATKAHVEGLPLDWPGVDLADMNGDRLQDIVRIRPSSVEVLAARGYGSFADKETISIPSITLTTSQSEAARLRDINGDGLADLILERASTGELWLWLNQGNYTFTDRVIITDMPTGQSPDTAVRWADMNGNGTVDLIYADALSTPRLQAVDLGAILGCEIDDKLLTYINHGDGCQISISYDSSTDEMLKDWSLVELATGSRAWDEPLPFTVSVVKEILGETSVGTTFTNKFSYSNGYYDGEESDYKGFADIEFDGDCDMISNPFVEGSEPPDATFLIIDGKTGLESSTNTPFVVFVGYDGGLYEVSFKNDLMDTNAWQNYSAVYSLGTHTYKIDMDHVATNNFYKIRRCN